MNNRPMTDEEVARELKVSVRTIQRLRKARKLGFCRVTAKKKVTLREHLDAYLKRVEESPKAA